MGTDHFLKRMAEEPALKGLDATVLLEMFKVVEEVRLPDAKVMVWEDTPVHQFGLVLEGSLALYAGAVVERMIGAGESFGVDELQSERYWRNTLVTRGQARVLVGASADFQRLVLDRADLCRVFGAHPTVTATTARHRRLRWHLRPQPVAFA